MRVMTIMGSPLLSGNTSRLLGWLEDDLRACGHSIDRCNVIEHQLSGCDECQGCQKSIHGPGCVLEDDGPPILERVFAAEAVVLATPLFAWSYSAQMKLLVDRFYCLLHFTGVSTPHSHASGKRFALVSTAGGPVENNLDLLVRQYRNLVELLHGINLGELLVPFCQGEASLDGDVRRRTVEFADSFVGKKPAAS